jgi:Tfp pilus assembly protein PilF
MKPTDAQCEQAEGWLRTAIEKNPKNMALRMHLADLYDMRGAYDRSEQLYRDVLAVEKGNVIALNNLAWLLAQHANKGEEALPYIDAAVQGVGRRADLLDTHGLVQLSRGHTDEALADLREAAADAPSPTRLFHLARALDAANDREAAKKTLREARKLGLTPDGLHPHEQLVCRRLLEKLGMN